VEILFHHYQNENFILRNDDISFIQQLSFPLEPRKVLKKQNCIYCMISEIFKKEIDEYMHFFIIDSELPRLNKVYHQQSITKYQNNHDFWFGYWIGHFTAYLVSLVKCKHARNPNTLELDEIREIVESNYTHVQKLLDKKFGKHD
jgi:hypothetical protein